MKEDVFQQKYLGMKLKKLYEVKKKKDCRAMPTDHDHWRGLR
jgi:hypothetical protein